MPRGSLDSRTRGQLEEEVQRLCSEGFSAIVIDLRALHFTEQAGNKLLHRLRDLAHRNQVALSLGDAAFAAAA